MYPLSEFCKSISYRGFRIGCNKYRPSYNYTFGGNRIFGTKPNPNRFGYQYDHIHSNGELSYKTSNSDNEFTGYFPTIESCKAAIDLYYEKQENDLSHSRV